MEANNNEMEPEDPGITRWNVEKDRHGGGQVINIPPQHTAIQSIEFSSLS